MIQNYKLENIGYKFTSHTMSGLIEMQFKDCSMVVNPMNFNQINSILKVFDVNQDDGYFLENLKGKYCRIKFNSDYYIEQLIHITDDDCFVVVR